MKKQKSASTHTEPIPVVYATDGSYAPYASASMESLIRNSGSRLRIYIFHTGLDGNTVRMLESSAREGAEVVCLDVSAALSGVKERLYAPSYLSPEMYYRALIPELLPEHERVVYLDCDTVILGDVGELYRAEMGTSAILAAKNPMHPKMRTYVTSLGIDPDRYVNSGVLLMDTAQLRDMGFTESFIRAASHRSGLRFPDQDLINILLKGRIGELAPEWNYIWHMERLATAADSELRMPPAELREYQRVGKRARLFHYTGDMKPWVHDALGGAEHFLAYAELCPMRGVIEERRRAALGGEEKVKLLFADFDTDGITLTCAHVLPERLEPKELTWSLWGESHRPEYTLIRHTISRGIRICEHVFSLSVSEWRAKREGAELRFMLSGREVLFEYGKFFPLNGYPESYFAYRGMLVYREGRALTFEACDLGRRLHRERVYLSALIRGRGKREIKHAALRVLYRLLRRVMPRGIWLLSDRPDTAGDNGEALFRYLLENGRRYGIRPYFVIRRDSPDYRRLRRVGRVLPLGSLRHKLLALIADVKAVSQTDSELYDGIERRFLKDLLMKETRVFLQHGITKDDMSSAYSRYTHDFDLLVTAAYPEYFSIITNPLYGLSPDRVALCGFPRHDGLVGKERERLLLVAPTWRKSLYGAEREDLLASRYFAAWRSLLMQDALPRLAARYGYRVVFLPHHHAASHLSLFSDISPEVEVRTDGARYRELLPTAALTVTDYSSVAFESAYLGRPVLYYRFDEREFFASHTYAEGYFDPRRDGFGEVAVTEDELLAALERMLARDCVLPPEIAGRRDAFFARCDGQSSRRVTEAILRVHRDKADD